MKQPIWWHEQTLRRCIIWVLMLKVLDGAVTTFLYTRPFWIDEWRVIYNLKAKDLSALWGTLDYLQQFPRLYLSAVKIFSAAFDYSYTSLRFPSFLVGSCAILLAWRVMRRIYPKGNWLQYLFVLVVVAAPPFTKYFVQVKQYTMDIALSILAVWQVLEVISLRDVERVRWGRYALLCGSLLLAPFFSYTYPIVVAPTYLIVILMAFRYRHSVGQSGLRLQCAALILSAVSISAFYWLDVRQLMADGGMKQYWQANLAPHMPVTLALMHFYYVFAQVGTGFVFTVIFGVLGSCAFFCSAAQAGKAFRQQQLTMMDWARLYSLLLLLIIAVLFVAGKLPLGEPRLNAFITTAIMILIIDMLSLLQHRYSRGEAVPVIGAILYLALAGNVIDAAISGYLKGDLARKRAIYNTIGSAIKVAGAQNLPILVTPGVAYPHVGEQNLPYTTPVPGDWILKTHPAYRMQDSIPVYPVAEAGEVRSIISSLPANVRGAVWCDGDSYRIVLRPGQ